jgi:hypothetical protein
MGRSGQGAKLPMVKFREIIRLHELGYNQSEIAQSCCVARSTVQDYIRRASGKGLSYQQLCQLSDSEAQAQLGKGKAPPGEQSAIDFATVHLELQGKGVTLALLWQEGLDQQRWQPELRSLLSSLSPLEPTAKPLDASASSGWREAVCRLLWSDDERPRPGERRTADGANLCGLPRGE